MKCVKNMESGKIVRMPDTSARNLVDWNPRKWSFASKSEWKAQSKNIAGRRKFYAR